MKKEAWQGCQKFRWEKFGKKCEKIGVEKTVDKWLEEVKSVENFRGKCCICNYETTWTNHYDGPIRNIKQQLEHIYYTLFCRCIAICQQPPVQLCWAKTIFLCQIISIFWIFFIQFYSAGHILSTAEVPNCTPTLISGRYLHILCTPIWILCLLSSYFCLRIVLQSLSLFQCSSQWLLKSFLLVNFHYFANFNKKSVLLSL